ncbi:MAG TPA: hypothetical protein DDW76_10405 [Cyanobacteria bacterium UBA11369]|nr:hypothetical protein [Cyanobacteria bacterium UBA11371]HBE30778.1 hypothetical protein [Cyanobacteria bacterium UBA11368]HBE49183.1 hypothetical protein [Cyanobacteria bacterium UBA11369]
MSNNQISDVSPLRSLTNLTILLLDNNQISDVTPLQSLNKLRKLQLGGNPIANQTCPDNLASVCIF